MNGAVAGCRTLVAAAMAVPVLWSAAPAAAEGYSDSDTVPWTFRQASTGDVVTCELSGTSSLFREDGEDSYEALAWSSVGGPEACRGSLTLLITYRDAGGTTRTTYASAAGAASSMEWGLEGISGALVVQHHVAFADCTEACSVSVTTQPK